MQHESFWYTTDEVTKLFQYKKQWNKTPDIVIILFNFNHIKMPMRKILW